MGCETLIDSFAHLEGDGRLAWHTRANTNEPPARQRQYHGDSTTTDQCGRREDDLPSICFTPMHGFPCLNPSLPKVSAPVFVHLIVALASSLLLRSMLIFSAGLKVRRGAPALILERG